MVFSIKYKVHQKLVGVMIIENIFHRFVRSGVVHEFDTIHNMALPYFFLLYVGYFAKERF